MIRQSRKLDHLKYAMALKDGPVANGFNDFSLIHNCLPDIASSDVTLSCTLCGLELNHPVIINAVTGGDKDVTEVNAKLAEFARQTNSVMAVGSQFAAIESPEVEESFNIVNTVNPDGIVFANIGAHATAKQAELAVKMIKAKAIQIHLNTAQELIMGEGDRDFSGYLENISLIAAAVNVPVIVKEVGCGIAKEQAIKLFQAGVKAIDVGGVGGTNFLAIEAARNKSDLDKETLSWGIPTAISTVETLSVLPSNREVIVSGGLRTPLEVVKAIALGGSAVGIANPILRLVLKNDMPGAVAAFKEFLVKVKLYMTLLGAKTIQDLHSVPIIITGKSKDWLTARNIDITQFANRQKHG
ncbi:MAG: type 2 isopentenyl-diphosphate Delta-isomerase [Negativicutes bacterium]|jgi:isopentenyl-diphosphate delta-isomerase